VEQYKEQEANQEIISYEQRAKELLGIKINAAIEAVARAEEAEKRAVEIYLKDRSIINSKVITAVSKELREKKKNLPNWNLNIKI